MKTLPDAPAVLWGDEAAACWDVDGAASSATVELDVERRVRESADVDGRRSLLRNADMGWRGGEGSREREKRLGII